MPITRYHGDCLGNGYGSSRIKVDPPDSAASDTSFAEATLIERSPPLESSRHTTNKTTRHGRKKQLLFCCRVWNPHEPLRCTVHLPVNNAMGRKDTRPRASGLGSQPLNTILWQPTRRVCANTALSYTNASPYPRERSAKNSSNRDAPLFLLRDILEGDHDTTTQQRVSSRFSSSFASACTHPQSSLSSRAGSYSLAQLSTESSWPNFTQTQSRLVVRWEASVVPSGCPATRPPPPRTPLQIRSRPSPPSEARAPQDPSAPEQSAEMSPRDWPERRLRLPPQPARAVRGGVAVPGTRDPSSALRVDSSCGACGWMSCG